MNRPKLVALDLDGTLLSSRHTISERNQRAIRALRDQGVMVLICTGRPIRRAVAYARELDLCDLAILYNGAVVYDFNQDKASYQLCLSQTDTLAVIDTLRERFPGASETVETVDGWYTNPTRYDAMDEPSVLPSGVGDVRDFVCNGVGESTVKCLFSHGDIDAPTLASAIDGLPVYRTWSSPTMLEVMARGVNKQVALERVATEFGIDRSEIAAFGDQNNDVEMLSWVGYGVAMGNAADDVKQAADAVTASNDEDGVAEGLEPFL